MPLCFQKAGLSCLRNNTKGKIMTRKTIKAALVVGLLAIAASSFAAEQSLPVPPPSGFADAESSVTVPIPTDEGRHLNLTLAFESTPSNAVLVALGRDLNGSETLEPEETELIVGVDCGEWFAREEVVVGGRSPTVERSCILSTTTTTNYNCEMKQPKAVSSRWTLARVTTHNLADTNLFLSND